jgi:hypothetical protein
MASGEFIEFLSKDALAELQKANAELVTMVSNVDKVGQKMRTITTPSGSDSAIKGLTAEYQKQEKAIQNTQKALEKARLDEIKLQQAREKAFDKYDAQLTKEQAKLNASQNIYNKIQAKINSLSGEYKSLATRKELGIALTDKEAKRYDFLQSKIQTYDKTLKAVDATMGKHQRNVGNYASGFNPISNSINQLTREMPAFTYSVQTGFMALSNNIPIFTDAIGNAIKQNKELIAQGKPTTSVLSQLAGAFFSWGTALSVAITLSTVYGKEIGQWISGITKSAKSIDTLKESQKQLNDINQEAQKNIVQETLNLKSLLAIAKDTSLSYKERMIAVKELQSTYPAYFGNLKQEEILAGNTAKAERDLTSAILSRAKANAAVSKITENQALVIDVELKRLELRKELDIVSNNILQTEKRLQNSSNVSNSQGIALSQMYEKQKNLISEINKLSGEKSDLDKINNTLTSFAIEKEKESILLKYRDEKATKDKTKAKEKELEVTEQITTNSEEAFKKSISALEKQLVNTDRFSSAYGVINGLLEIQKELYDQLFGSIKQATDAKEEYAGIELSDEQVYADYFAWLKLKEATDGYIKTLASDAFNRAFDNIGLSSAKMFFDFDLNGQSTFDKLIEGADSMKEKFAITFQSVGDTAQDVFNKMNEMSNQRFENQRMNLEREYKIGLAFAGDSASARAEIEAQYQERQRQIQRREFQARKEQALFNIAIDTAQGVVSALASTPPNVPLSIAIGAIGLVQAGIVASQQMPQFWTGVENSTYEGWATKDEKGAEIQFDKNGKIKDLGQNKGAKYTYVERGDTILNHKDSMDYLMFNKELNSMLTNNSIDKAPSINIESSKIDLSPVVKAINDKPVANIGIDKNGFEYYIESANQRKNNMNKRITFSGKSV